EYFNGIKCVQKKVYLDQCTESQQCLDSELTFCNSTYCVCQETEYFLINKCVPRVAELETCYYTEMCLKDMVCNGTNCMCLGNKFYDSTTNKCTDQKIVNNYCDKDLECRSDLGLVCTGNRCICGSSSHTWSNTNQKCLLTYSKRSCLTGDSCNPDQNLKCINDQCNCPIASVDGMCDCSSTEGSEEFWNGSFCSSAKNYSGHCLCHCLCNTECRVKKSINSMCDNDWQCSSLKGLTCQSNRCLCTLNTHTWDTTNE
ncbi:prion-like-(Q N-rich) domain-bearing 25, partial [Brachionus plicatilis]